MLLISLAGCTDISETSSTTSRKRTEYCARNSGTKGCACMMTSAGVWRSRPRNSGAGSCTNWLPWSRRRRSWLGTASSLPGSTLATSGAALVGRHPKRDQTTGRAHGHQESGLRLPENPRSLGHLGPRGRPRHHRVGNGSVGVLAWEAPSGRQRQRKFDYGSKFELVQPCSEEPTQWQIGIPIDSKKRQDKLPGNCFLPSPRATVFAR
jgi:hypothetical protein